MSPMASATLPASRASETRNGTSDWNTGMSDKPTSALATRNCVLSSVIWSLAITACRITRSSSTSPISRYLTMSCATDSSAFTRARPNANPSASNAANNARFCSAALPRPRTVSM